MVMAELEYPSYLSEDFLYNSVQDVLKGEGYFDEDEGEFPYTAEDVEVDLGDVLEVSASSDSEEQQIVALLSNRLNFS